MSKKSSAKHAAKKSPANRSMKDLAVRDAGRVKGGAPMKADGSLDAGIHFKYDIKAQKEG